MYMKVVKAVVVLVGLTLTSCGPGVVDGTESIGNGYFLADTGGNGRTIEFHGEGEKPRTIIEPRVEGYARQGPIIVAARRPASVVIQNGSAEWQVSQVCEYWIVDTTTHAARVTTDEREYGSVRCR